jgi:hypothetical protein
MTANLGRKAHLRKYLPYDGKWQFFPVVKINGRPKPELVIIDGKPRRGMRSHEAASSLAPHYPAIESTRSGSRYRWSLWLESRRAGPPSTACFPL